MTGRWKDRRGAVAALAVVALGVWAAVGWRVAGEAGGEGGPALEPIVVGGPTGGEGAEGAPPPYLGSGDDPFQPPPGVLRPAAGPGVSAPRGAPPVPRDPPGTMTFDEALAYGPAYGPTYAPEPPAPGPPPLYVVGVVGGRAILELDGGGSALAGPGERVGEVEVLTVSPSLVTLRYRGVEYESPPGG